MARAILLLPVLFAPGCFLPFFTHSNVELKRPEGTYEGRATFDVKEDRGNNEDVMVLLALSGGGSRAAYFSGAVMLELGRYFPDIDILKEVDVISSVSGGSLAAAYYCISEDPAGPSVRLGGQGWSVLRSRGEIDDAERARLLERFPAEAARIDLLQRFSRFQGSGKVWDRATVRRLMSRNYLHRWLVRWTWPWNILRYWSTGYDRSDIMADTLATNLYGAGLLGPDLEFRELHPERPYLILNSTDATQDVSGEDSFAGVFTFTHEHFRDRLASDIAPFRLAGGVMASAAFPGAFSYVTLRDYRGKKQYRHVFDGGNSDNLGLRSVKKVILEAMKRPRPPRRFVVILVDSYTKPGIDRNRWDPRGLLSYILDLNFIDTFDAFLDANRESLLREFSANRLVDEETGECREAPGLIFCPIAFNDVGDRLLRKGLNRIPTSFRISGGNVRLIDECVRRILARHRRTLEEIREALLGP